MPRNFSNQLRSFILKSNDPLTKSTRACHISRRNSARCSKEITRFQLDACSSKLLFCRRDVRRGGEPAKHCVNHAAGKLTARLFRQFNTLVDGRMRRNAVEMQELKRSETQGSQNLDIQFHVRMFEKLTEAVVQLDF